jgi:hypothetical protein
MSKPRYACADRRLDPQAKTAIANFNHAGSSACQSGGAAKLALRPAENDLIPKHSAAEAFAGLCPLHGYAICIREFI